jgi:hypothetical protein
MTIAEYLSELSTSPIEQVPSLLLTALYSGIYDMPLRTEVLDELVRRKQSRRVNAAQVQREAAWSSATDGMVN